MIKLRTMAIAIFLIAMTAAVTTSFGLTVSSGDYVKSNPITNDLFMTYGPGYPGGIYVNNTGNSNIIASGSEIYINNTFFSLFPLQVNDSIPGSGNVQLWINGTIPKGLYILIVNNTTDLFLSGSNLFNLSYLSEFYISFLNFQFTRTQEIGTLYFNFIIDHSITISYEYRIITG